MINKLICFIFGHVYTEEVNLPLSLDGCSIGNQVNSRFSSNLVTIRRNTKTVVCDTCPRCGKKLK